MLHQALNVVKNFLREHYPEVRLEDGAMWDLYCKGFDILFDDVVTDMNSYLADLDIRNYATMSEADLNRLAANWFLTRSFGNRGTTVVTIRLRAATKVDINQGMVLGTTDGYRFLASQDISFSASQISDSQSGNYYLINVPVIAESTGTEYNVASGEINTIISPFHFDVAYVGNQSAITNGVNQETNTEFYQRIVRSVNTRDLLITRNSIATVVLNNFPTLRAVEVAGKGDARMDRDRQYNVLMPGGFSPYQRSDFWAKRQGITRFNKNIGREGRLDSATLGTVAAVEAEAAEIEQEDYYDLYGLDLEYFVTRGGLEMFDDFEIFMIGVSNARVQGAPGWICTDSGLEFGQTVYGNSISVYNGWLCLGATALTTSSLGV
jgi:hypothetical protein